MSMSTRQTPEAASCQSPLQAETQVRYELLQRIVCEMESVLVAYSGGVDSALLLRVAHDVLGERALGAIAHSPAYASEETQGALDVAARMGIAVLTVQTHEMEDERYVANDLNRCYFCKMELFTHLVPLARQHNLRHIAYGQNIDDLGDFRPGQRAAREFAVRAPLKEAGLGKEDIRAIARLLGVPVWNKPAQACFSSRIPYGTKIEVASLQMIYQAEKLLHELGFRQVRVRHHGTLARIEVERTELARLIEEQTSRAVSEGLRTIGYLYVTVDLQGFRSGSMNEGFFKRKTTSSLEK